MPSAPWDDERERQRQIAEQMSDDDLAEGTKCQRSPDDTHCNCWWDEIGPCCYCGQKGPMKEETQDA